MQTDAPLCAHSGGPVEDLHLTSVPEGVSPGR
jgi:hypothetical protein